MMGMIHGSLILGGIPLSEIINWIASRGCPTCNKYIITGASWYEDSLELWVDKNSSGESLSMQEFQDVIIDGWEMHFNSQGGSYQHQEGHFMWFSYLGPQADGNPNDWGEDNWGESRNKDILNRIISTLTEHWDAEWEIGYGHRTEDGQYEVRWCKINGS